MPPTDLIPACWREDATRVASALANADRVLVAGHANPDGDAIGSMAAAGWLLKALGKEFVIFAEKGVPAYLGFAPMPGVVRTSLGHLPFTPACGLWLDCSEPHRLGTTLEEALPTFPASINIDHHLGSGGMGSVANWVEPRAAACAQLVAYVALACGLPLQGELATAIGLGLMTDTGRFAHGNTTPEIFDLCAHLSRNGCNFAELCQQLEHCWSKGRMHLWGELMTRVQALHGGQLGFCRVELADLARHGACKDDLEGFVEQIRCLAGVRMAALLREDAPDICKFSLRSYGAWDVRSVAAGLGGGGHFNAAGGTLRMPPAEAERTLLAALDKSLDKALDAAG